MKLGVIGTGRIAGRFVPEARLIEGLSVEMVYNPHIDSVRRFAKELEMDAYTDNLEELLLAVDAVYIASPHETHYAYTKKALSLGKHVLCEKPMVFKKEQALELFVLAQNRGCVLMEAIKTAYCPGFQKLVGLIKQGKIGEVRDVEACFSRLTPADKRERKDTVYGGSFTEFGTYTLLPIVKILGLEEKKTDYWMMLEENGIDGYAKVAVDYGKSIGLSKTGVTAKSEGELVIAGSKGYILVAAPWWQTRHFEVRYEDPAKKESFDFPYEGQGLRYEIRAFVDEVKDRNGRTPGVLKEESIWMAEKMESFLNYREALKNL